MQEGTMLEWALGILSTGVLGVAGLLWKRINSVERDLKEEVKDLRKEINASSVASSTARDKQWNALENVRKEVSDFKEKVLTGGASKDDLKEFRTEFTGALNTVKQELLTAIREKRN